MASHNAGVTVVIIGISNHAGPVQHLFSITDKNELAVKETDHINAYLVPAPNVIVDKQPKPTFGLTEMRFGNKPVDGGNLFLNFAEKKKLLSVSPDSEPFIRNFSNSEEFINGKQRYCLWIDDSDVKQAFLIPEIQQRVERVCQMRLASSKKQTQLEAATAYRFSEIRH